MLRLTGTKTMNTFLTCFVQVSRRDAISCLENIEQTHDTKLLSFHILFQEFEGEKGIGAIW